MLRNLASSLFLTERDPDDDRAPKVRGRVVTTLHKAKEVRPLVEKCITIARHSLEHQDRADDLETDAERNTEEWKSWRQSDKWQEWNAAIAPVVAARRRAVQLLGDKEAVQILFDDIAPRFADRPGGYTRIMRLATPRLGDAGVRAILEFVGVHDRVDQKSEKPAFADDDDEEDDDELESSADDASEEESAEDEASTDDGAEETAEDSSDDGDAKENKD